MEQGLMRHALCKNDPVNDPAKDPINGPISGPVTLTERQELILQMFAEDKCLSIGRLCEKNGTSCYNSYMRDGIPKKVNFYGS